MNTANLLLSLPLGALAIATLAGCSVVDGLQHEASADYASTSELSAGFGEPVPWVPADATQIRTRYATNGDAAILRATTTSPLDPEVCGEIERLSGPVFEQDWSGDAYVDNAWVCDNWTVVATDDGWYGWTPNDPDEQYQSPENLISPSINTP